jgi:hypothetical protein
MPKDTEDKVARIVLQELTGKNDGVVFVRLRREITEKHPSIPPQQVFRSVSQLIESHDVSFTPAGALALTGMGHGSEHGS